MQELEPEYLVLASVPTCYPAEALDTLPFDPRFGSGSTSILAPGPDPLRFLFPDPLKALIWIRVAPTLYKVKSKTNVFYLRNAFSKFWR